MRDHMKKVRRYLMLATALLLMGALAGPAWAVDGVIEINQARALKGGVTPGDEPGFPVTISQAGSYRLTGNLTVPASTTAIQITVNNVTIDLNGFAIIGPVICSGPSACSSGATGVGIDGFDSSSFRSSVTVLNGTVRGMGHAGVRIGAHSRVYRVNAIGNAGNGISVEANSGVTASVAVENAGTGIRAVSSVVRGNTANGNQDGIDASGSLVIGNVAVGNRGYGLTGAAGYAHNVLSGSNFPFFPATQLGPNVCGTALCP